MTALSKKILSTIQSFEEKGDKKYDPISKKEYSSVSFKSVQGVRVNIPCLGFRQPSKTFEEKHNITEISQNYYLPKGLTASTLQTYLMLTLWRDDISEKERLKAITEVSDALIKLNPILLKIKINPCNAMEKYHLSLGVISAFNIDDISHFVLDGGNAMSMYEGRPYKKLSEVFNQVSIPLELGWVASPKTLTLIKAKMFYPTEKIAPKKQRKPKAP